MSHVRRAKWLVSVTIYLALWLFVFINNWHLLVALVHCDESFLSSQCDRRKYTRVTDVNRFECLTAMLPRFCFNAVVQLSCMEDAARTAAGCNCTVM